MSITVTITRQRIIDGFTEAAKRNLTSPEEFVVGLLDKQGKIYADLFKIGVITSAAFIARFTPAEYAGILAAAETDPIVDGLLNTLLSEPIVNFDDERLIPGLQVLVDSQLIDESRLPELLSFEHPTPYEQPIEEVVPDPEVVPEPDPEAV